MPASGDLTDPEKAMSIIYDNRSRIGLRTSQFLTGKRYSQMPASLLCRVICNIEVMGEEPGGLRVAANMLLYESLRCGQLVWAARYEYLLRAVEGEYCLAFKKVVLVKNDMALTTMAFLMYLKRALPQRRFGSCHNCLPPLL